MVTKDRKEVISIMENLVFTIHKTSDIIKAHEDKILREYNLTAEQFRVLLAIGYLGGNPKVSEIAHQLTRRPNSITMIVDRMVKAGLVNRMRSRDDRRIVHVTTTTKGDMLVGQAAGVYHKFVDGLLSHVPGQDKEIFRRTLDLMVRWIQ
jgi:DNA-binding MarR family transcriptional regulator